MDYKEFLSYQVGGNTVQDLAIAIATFVGIYIVLAIAWKLLLGKLQAYTEKTKFQFDDIIVGVLQGIGAPFYIVVSLYVSVQPLVLSSLVLTGIKAAVLVVIIAEVIKLAERVIQFFIVRAMYKGRKETEDDKRLSSVFSIFIKIGLWSVGLLLILSNLGFNVTSLIAGLGIGGLAISLALQNILSDMFSSLSIAVDKPFEEGDFIVIGQDKGTVKHIGIKTTRLMSIQGEEIVISNNELTTARIQNFKKMKKRRVVFTIGVTYSTPIEKLERADEIIKDVITKEDKAEFDRVHFFEFGDFSLNFEIVYFMLTSDYNEYMDTQQSINLAILDAFTKEGIEMAFPTQTVYIEKG